MSETKRTTTITATPCGTDRHGQPLKPRQYVVDERREDWGSMEEAITGKPRENRTRIFVRRPDLDVPGNKWGPAFAPVVVRTDSIVEESTADITRCSHPMCPFPATRQAYVDDWDGSPWATEAYAPYCAGHAPAGSWTLVASEATVR